MSEISSTSDSEFGHAAPPAVAISRPGLGATLSEYFLRFVIVALGIGFGLIVAVFIGLVTGWISIGC